MGRPRQVQSAAVSFPTRCFQSSHTQIVIHTVFLRIPARLHRRLVTFKRVDEPGEEGYQLEMARDWNYSQVWTVWMYRRQG